MTTTTTAAAPTTRTVHEIALRISDDQGVWARLPGHHHPAPRPELDAQAAAPDPRDPCARRGCTRPATRYLSAHRRHARHATREWVGLCNDDFGAHWTGEAFDVRVVVGDAPARRQRYAAVSRRILVDRFDAAVRLDRTGGEFSPEYQELAGALHVVVRTLTGWEDGGDDEDAGTIVDEILEGGHLAAVMAAAIDARLGHLTAGG